MHEESIALHRVILVDVRGAIPKLLGTIKNARRINTSLGLPTESALNQLETDGEEIQKHLEADEAAAGVRIPGQLRRTLRLAMGLWLNKLNEVRNDEEQLTLDTKDTNRRIREVEKLIRTLDDQLDIIDHQQEEPEDK